MLKGLQNGVNMRWGLFMPNGSAMKAVAKLVDDGKVTKHCLLKLFAVFFSSVCGFD